MDEIYAGVTVTRSESLLTPNIGRKRFIGALGSQGLHIQRWRGSDCLRRVDPVGTALQRFKLFQLAQSFISLSNRFC